MVVARDRLRESVWGADWFGDDHVVDVHIANLAARSTNPAPASRFLRTVRGVGYRMGDGT